MTTVAAIQMACEPDQARNLAHAQDAVRAAAARGAHVVLLPELFETPYFCKDQDPQWFALAKPWRDHPTLTAMAALAHELGVVLPVSFFERAGTACFNSLAVLDADGRMLGIYRKSHIPDSPGYHEKFFFSPGDTGFRAWATRYGRIGVGICWDQWFPEAARAMALQDAELLLYPTAIGSEPQDAALDTRDHWRRVMQGHAAANIMPLVAANRFGREDGRSVSITFYGSSFITGPTGELIAEAARDRPDILLARFDLAAIAQQRQAWGVFRDRRPELYGCLLRQDGSDPNSS